MTDGGAPMTASSAGRDPLPVAVAAAGLPVGSVLPTMPESPTYSPRRGLRLGMVSVVLLCGGLFGWGLLASIAGAIIVEGRVEAEAGEQAVEHVDGGTVAAILVRDGDRVAAGAVLARIDGGLMEAEAAALEAELHDLVARRNRLEAEVHDLEAIDWDPLLREAGDASVQAVLDGHRRLFEARLASRAGLVTQLRERIGQIRRQIAGLESQSRALARQNVLTVEELGAKQELFDKGLGHLSDLLSLRRGLANLDGEAGKVEAEIASARGRIAEIRAQILQIQAQHMEEAETEARRVQARENTVRERLRGLRERLGRLEVRAPVAGIVHDLSVSAVGEVLQPGEPVAKVVPEDGGLAVRARLLPTDVDQVWPGQQAVLRFSAFQARTTPEYSGEVRRVSADALTDERGGLSWYEVEIGVGEPVSPDPDGGWFDWTGTATGGSAEAPDRAASLELSPGMPVEAYLRTGDRSPLSWMLKPFTDYLARALRED